MDPVPAFVRGELPELTLALRRLEERVRFWRRRAKADVSVQLKRGSSLLARRVLTSGANVEPSVVGFAWSAGWWASHCRRRTTWVDEYAYILIVFFRIRPLFLYIQQHII